MSRSRTVYQAVRDAGLGRIRALRCVGDVWRGSWTARDAGEMRAQATLLANVARRDADVSP